MSSCPVSTRADYIGQSNDNDVTKTSPALPRYVPSRRFADRCHSWNAFPSGAFCARRCTGGLERLLDHLCTTPVLNCRPILLRDNSSAAVAMVTHELKNTIRRRF